MWGVGGGQIITGGGVKFEAVKKFHTPGCNNWGSSSAEIKWRWRLARISMDRLDKIWKNRDISTLSEARLLRALVCWRRMMRISWMEKRRYKSVLVLLEQLNIRTRLIDKVKSKGLALFRHIVRGGGPEKSVMFVTGNGSCRRGRSKIRWIDGILNCPKMKLWLTMGRPLLESTRWSYSYSGVFSHFIIWYTVNPVQHRSSGKE